MKKIQAIDKHSIQRICCGQVVVDLATAVKELLENSLDSGATCIEIKLKEMGTELIEVIDNGSGIDPDNYEALAIKHCTSKLEKFSDLMSVQSFGFRGEALNALCELSGSFRVSTKVEAAKVGAALTFAQNGHLLSQKPVARSVGTTVTIERLFDALPVRRGEFVRSAKKQFQKLLKLLQSYAVILCGVQITVVNITKNTRSVSLATQLSTRIEDNISSVFGSKFLGTLLPLAVIVPSVDDNIGSKEKMPEECNAVSIATSSGNTGVLRCVGFVSKPREGVGRSDSDRQYVFCNGRPVDLPRVHRLFNEMWRRFEMSQKPAFILNIEAPPGAFDINLSPDKREVVFAKQKEIIEALQEALEQAFIPSRNTFQVSTTSVDSSHISQSSIADYVRVADQQLPNPSSTSQSTSVSRTSATDANFGDINKSPGFSLTTSGPADESELEIASVTEDSERLAFESWLHGDTSDQNEKVKLLATSAATIGLVTSGQGDDGGCNRESDYEEMEPESSSRYGKESTHDRRGGDIATDVEGNRTNDCEGGQEEEEVEVVRVSRSQPAHLAIQSKGSKTAGLVSRKKRKVLSYLSDSDELTKQDVSSEDEEVEWDMVTEAKAGGGGGGSGSVGKKADNGSEMTTARQSSSRHSHDDCIIQSSNMWRFDPQQVLRRVRASYIYANEGLVARSDGGVDVSKEACSVNGSANQQAQVEANATLTRIICKEDFVNMKILGQFNVGFIVAELRGDLYILDQHACDEKYRFEMLSDSTAIHKQKLIVPLPLETSPREESIICENLDVFENNGFDFIIDVTQPPGHRIRVTTLPLCQSVQFGVRDVHDLASLIDSIDGIFDGDNKVEGDTCESQIPNLVIKNFGGIVSGKSNRSVGKRKLIKLPRLVSVFASKACRSSVMIGTHLKTHEMRQIVDNLGTIEQPWNCPHGRPTMRHLIDLKNLYCSRLVSLSEEVEIKRARIDKYRADSEL